jgi:hypothetical protein
MVNVKLISVLIASILLAFVIDVPYNYLIRILVGFWVLNLLVNIFLKKFSYKLIRVIYREELFASIFLLFIFYSLGLPPLVYTFTVLGLTEIVVYVTGLLHQKPNQSKNK